ncbi:MAG TPA: DUF72 domain-containing protein [Polyangiaceae bacterium]|nr:DUF72 domain-containing protein [Polyangiaceae bacterium]
MQLYAGTSGFSYPKWKGGFYPKDAKTDALLHHYALRLPSVEINNTFYRMPRENVVLGWKSQVPADFRFSMKASRRITHYAKLKDTEDSVQYLLQALSPLGPSLGVVLFQLPPQFQKDVGILKAFLSSMPESPRIALEFRHHSWFDDEVYGLLADAKAALVGGDGDDSLPALVPTTDFGYLRLRADAYDDAALSSWNARLASSGWRHAFVYFKHEGLGPRLAEQLIQLGGGAAAPAISQVAGNKPKRPGLKKTAPKPAKSKRKAR